MRLLFVENVLNSLMTSGKYCFASFGTRSLKTSVSFASSSASDAMQIEREVNSRS